VSGQARAELVAYWMRKADTALASGASEAAASRFDFAANRAYYACFHAASAVLLSAGRRFVKHSGVRGAVHQELVKTGRIGADSGKAYDRIFDAPQAADYLELFSIGQTEADDLLQLARGFVAEMQRLVSGSTGQQDMKP
jgi:uncharacterized protein (UPF0332 family)